MDGFMFYMNGKARLYSELSQEDYRAWSKDRHAASGGDIMDAVTLAASSSTRTCTEDETSYTVTLSGLDQAALCAMDSLTKSLQELDSGVRMTDATITAVLDKTTYLASSIEVAPVFTTDTANATVPTMTCTCTITDWNNATVETVDPTTLNKSDDLRLLYALKDQYDAMDEALTGSYLDSCVYHIALRYSITQGIHTFIGTQVVDTTLEFGDYVLPDTATDVETN